MCSPTLAVSLTLRKSNKIETSLLAPYVAKALHEIYVGGDRPFPTTVLLDHADVQAIISAMSEDDRETILHIRDVESLQWVHVNRLRYCVRACARGARVHVVRHARERSVAGTSRSLSACAHSTS